MLHLWKTNVDRHNLSIHSGFLGSFKFQQLNSLHVAAQQPTGSVSSGGESQITCQIVTHRNVIEIQSLVQYQFLHTIVSTCS